MSTFYLVIQPLTERMVVVNDPSGMKLIRTVEAETLSNAYQQLHDPLLYNRRQGYGYYE